MNRVVEYCSILSKILVFQYLVSILSIFSINTAVSGGALRYSKILSDTVKILYAIRITI